jgi:hypothetical protein
MATIEELKSRIDLHDLADKLGLKRGASGNYHSPHRKDENPSLSVYVHNGVPGWKDHAGGPEAKGSCIDLVLFVEGGDVAGAVKRLHELYGWPLDRPKGQGQGQGASTEPQREKSRAEYIADRCLTETKRAFDYLVEERKITPDVAQRAIARKMVGFNDWTSAKIEAGQHGHGGAACAFIVRTLNPGHVVAVDLRYLDPTLNGGTKTQCQGEKRGYGWTSDLKRLMAAERVIFVESPINALSVECALRHPRVAAFAIRGVANTDLDWTWMRGKQAILCMDNDKPFPALTEKGEPHPMAGIRPGLQAAWSLHESMTALDISALLVSQEEWEHNDVNDILKAEGPDALKSLLGKLEPWLIPGMVGKVDGAKKRVFLPAHHFGVYQDYRVKEDFTSIFAIRKVRNADGEEQEIPYYKDLAGFRIASISRVRIQSAGATMTGDDDSQPKTLFAVSVQTTRHGAMLVRKVVEDEKLHNIDSWKKFGPVFTQVPFLRMVNLLECGAHIGARDAANFVGLCFKDGELKVNEGPDCYFTSPEQQCPYHNLTFPTGTRQDARTVIAAYQQTFGRNAALLALIWGLGAHLKVLLGFWPHMEMQADKGAGKSTLIKRMERSIAFTMLSGQSMQTEYRLLTSISHTSHPVGWEELSARRQDIIDKAVGLLQENYQYTVTRRGADMTEYLLSAPVMLAGEDVPVRSLIGKLVRTKLVVKGAIIADDLPRFPVRQWLEFLTSFTPAQVRAIYATFKDKCLEQSRASGTDDGATRMAGNYAALLTAWRLLAEFAEIDVRQGELPTDLVATMNDHIKETSADRAPWVWILETALAEIARHKFEAPHVFDRVEDEDGKGHECLLIRTSDVMHHLATTSALKDLWNALPVKSDRILKKQLTQAGVTIGDGHERTIGAGMTRRRVAHMTALSLSQLAGFGLHAIPTNDIPPL